MRISYEIKAYENGYLESKSPTKWKMEHCIGCGTGKKAKSKAIQQANEMWNTGKFEAVFVDAYNNEEIVDSECVNIPSA